MWWGRMPASSFNPPWREERTMADNKTTYQVLSPLKHDGMLYMPAEGKIVKVALSDEEADTLLTMNIIGELPAGPAKPQK